MLGINDLSNLKYRSLNSKRVIRCSNFACFFFLLSVTVPKLSGTSQFYQETHYKFKLPAVIKTKKEVPHVETFEL